jgi:Na+/H+-dicarboxylate symporter
VPLLKFLLCNYIGFVIQVIFIYGGLLLFVGRLNPLPFFSGMKSAMAFAFSTNSSSATLPVSMHCVQNNLGVSRGVTSFVLPLGSTINMDGAAIFQAITAVFISQSYGIDLSWMELGTIVVTAILSAVGAAGIPGSSLVMISVVLGAVGLPLEGIMVIAGVDRIREMGSTVTNILGDAVVAVTVAKSEGELDESQYNHTEVVEFEESDL